MKKHLSLLLTLAFCLIFSLAAYAEKSTPIDNAFTDPFEKALSTAQQRYVAAEYLGAWKNELNNLALQLKNQYKYEEDKKKVDEYLLATEKSALTLSALEWINWSNYNEPPGKARHFGTGAPGAAILAEASVYKSSFLKLLEVYKAFSETESTYQYIFDAKKINLQ